MDDALRHAVEVLRQHFPTATDAELEEAARLSMEAAAAFTKLVVIIEPPAHEEG